MRWPVECSLPLSEPISRRKWPSNSHADRVIHKIVDPWNKGLLLKFYERCKHPQFPFESSRLGVLPRIPVMSVDQIPHLLTMDEVAARFRVSRRSFQLFIRQYPYYRTLGRRKLFTEADIARLYEALPCPSSSPAGTPVLTGTSAAPSVASLWTRAQVLLTERQQKPSARSGNGKSSKPASMVGKRQQAS